MLAAARLHMNRQRLIGTVRRQLHAKWGRRERAADDAQAIQHNRAGAQGLAREHQRAIPAQPALLSPPNTICNTSRALATQSPDYAVARCLQRGILHGKHARGSTAKCHLIGRLLPYCGLAPQRSKRPPSTP